MTEPEPRVNPGRGRKAGAPPGNRNAVKSGRYVADPSVRRALRSAKELLSRRDFEAIIAAYKASAAKGIDLPSLRPHVRNVLAFERPSITTTPTTAEQLGREETLCRWLERYEFRGVAVFVRRHRLYLAMLEDTLRFVDAMPPEQFAQIENHGAFINADFHKTIAVPRGSIDVCPVEQCRWEDGQQLSNSRSS